MENEPDWMTALWVADEDFNDPSSPDYGQGLNSLSCFPACPSTGPFTFFNQPVRFTRRRRARSRGRSYNALQLTLRKRWSHGYQFDVNYTLAHAMDHRLIGRTRRSVR